MKSFVVIFSVLFLLLGSFTVGAPTTTDEIIEEPPVFIEEPLPVDDLPSIDISLDDKQVKNKIEVVELRTLNSRTWYKDGEYLTRVFTKPIFKEKEVNSLFPLIYDVYADTTSTFSGAGDGRAWGGDGNVAWDTAHDSSGDGADDNDTSETGAGSTYFGANQYQIQRGFYPFDTSGLDDGATITSASLYVYVESKLDNDDDGNDYIVVVETDQASTASLTDTDYSTVGSVALSDTIDIGNVSTSAYNEWTLNSTGLSLVSLTGWTKIGLREGHDFEDDPNTGHCTITVRFSDYAGTDYDPYLEIVWTGGGSPPGGGSGQADYLVIFCILLLLIFIVLLFEQLTKVAKRI